MATADKQAGLYALTAPMVMMFPNLFVPKKFKGSDGKERGEPKFSGLFLSAPDHPDVAGLKAKAAAVAKATWPGADFATISWPFKNGDVLAKKAEDQKKNGDVFKGKFVLKAASKYEPRLSIFTNGAVLDLEGDAKNANKGKFYQGVQVLVEVNFVAQEVDGKRSVTAYLNLVFSTGKGDRIGGKSAADVFKGYAGKATQEDPTGGAGVDDEIPF